jgi:hypothetical protein
MSNNVWEESTINNVKDSLFPHIQHLPSSSFQKVRLSCMNEHMMYSSLSGASFLIWLLGTAVYNVLMGMAFHPIIYLTNTSTYDGNEGDL